MSDTDCTIDSDELGDFLANKRPNSLDGSDRNKVNPKKVDRKPFQITRKSENPIFNLHNMSNSDSEDDVQVCTQKPQEIRKPFHIPKKNANPPKKPSNLCSISSSDSENERQQCTLKPITKINKNKKESLTHNSNKLPHKLNLPNSESDDEVQSSSHKPQEIKLKPFPALKKKQEPQQQSSKFPVKSNQDSEDDTQKLAQVSSGKGAGKQKEMLFNSSSGKPLCKYGNKCYRKNPDHLKAFSHPTDPTSTKRPDVSSSPELTRKKWKRESRESQMLAYEKNVFGFHLTKVSGISKQFNCGLALDIKDLLSPSQGKLIASAQFNFMIDIPWLVEQYPPEFRNCPLTIVHGEQRASKQALEKSASRYPNIKFCQAKLEIMYGTHHTKMMLLLYEDGLRVVIHTSNLVDSDWFQKTQGMWVSPKFPKLLIDPCLTVGESSTNFKADLVEYLTSYNSKELEEWVTHLKKHDLSQAKVFIIGSTPGRHIGSKKTAFGHLKLRKVLHCNGPSKDLADNKWPVIGQFSSIGSLGTSPDQWLCGEWLTSLATVKTSTPATQQSMLKLVYPTVDNVRCSLEGYPAGASLPYSYKVASKQPYLRGFLHQWKSASLGRSEASPHIKTYLRTSPDKEQIAWFLVTSANLSKAAWGALEKNGVQLMIRSYELGVLFMPSKFNVGDTFCNPNSQSIKSGTAFPVPFDLPLTPYDSKDRPWIWDIPQIHAPDRNGNKWCPS